MPARDVPCLCVPTRADCLHLSCSLLAESDDDMGFGLFD